MMRIPLTEILGNGMLVDNTLHSAQDGVFRAGQNGTPVEIRCGNGWWYNPRYVWPLLRTAASLETSHSNVLLRGPDADYEHNTDDAFIHLSGDGPLDFTLKTGNLIGCVKSGAYTLSVSSRFGDEFLKYIIADADGFTELPEHGGMDRGSYEWLLIYIWLIKLKKAFRLGLPKAYATRTEMLSHVRGRLDPVDYALNRQPGRFNCTYREHTYDNDITRLIAYTLRHLDSHAMVRSAHTLSQAFQVATQGRRSSLQDLLRTKEVRNPYFADYNPVIALAKQILRNELSGFGAKSDTNAFFFDVSMLFEYFVRKLLKRAGVSFHQKSDRNWSIPSGLMGGYTRRRLIPDLIFETGEGTYIFDVKYKSFDFSKGVSREDLFQLHTYIGQVANRHSIAGCGFIYPIRESRWRDYGLTTRDGIFSDTIVQGGRTIPFHVAFLKVPDNPGSAEGGGAQDFHKLFRHSTTQFLEVFLNRLRSSKSARQVHTFSGYAPYSSRHATGGHKS